MSKKPAKKLLYTGEKIFNLKLYIESTGRDDVDKAMKHIFHDEFTGNGALYIIRKDVQLVLAWSRGETIEPEKGMGLFEGLK